MNINLDSKRLVLRSFIQEDWLDMKELWIDYANSVYACYDQANPLDDVSIYERINAWIYINNKTKFHHYLAVCNKVKVIGFFSIHPYQNGCELGYAFHSAYHHLGFASEALTTLLQFLKDNGCLVCYVRTGLKNIPSVNLLRRNSFTCIDTEPISFYKDDDDNPIYFTGGIFKKEL